MTERIEKTAWEWEDGGEENPFPGDWQPLSDQERSKIGREFVNSLVKPMLGAHIRPSPVCPERKPAPVGPWPGPKPAFTDGLVNHSAPTWWDAAGMYYRTFGEFPAMAVLTDRQREDIISGAWAERHPRRPAGPQPLDQI